MLEMEKKKAARAADHIGKAGVPIWPRLFYQVILRLRKVPGRVRVRTGSYRYAMRWRRRR